MPIEPEAFYVQLGRLVEAMPDLSQSVDTARMQWIGRVRALMNAAHRGDVGHDIDELGQKLLTTDYEGGRRDIGDQIAYRLYRVLAEAELDAPVATEGAFIPAGNAFDALAAFSRILSEASADILMVDPYMDEKALLDFAPLAREGVDIRLLAEKGKNKPTLGPAVTRWRTQYGGKRPLKAALSVPASLHDRLLVVDNKNVWVLTQSLNAFAARAPASIVRVDPETATLKVAAYQDIWTRASLL